MDKKNARQLVNLYMDGWKENDILKIKTSLSKNCTVIESHGPEYNGINKIEKWFELWLEAKSHVLKWDLKSFYFCEEEQIVFCEWDFFCISNFIIYQFPGSSIVKFLDNKISFINEYRMTHKPYIWQAKELNSS